jgi:hypothetical protein
LRDQQDHASTPHQARGRRRQSLQVVQRVTVRVRPFSAREN